MQVAHSSPSKLNLSSLLILLFIAAAGLWLVRSNNPDDDLRAEVQEALDSGIEIPIALNGCNNFKLKDFKSLKRWIKQFKTRGFSKAKISDMLQHGRREFFTDGRGNNLLRIFDADGNYIVLDPLTCEIWQIAPNTFLY